MLSGMTQARWQRLADDLEAAGIPASITVRAFPGGTSRSITLRAGDGSLVCIHDKWWSKNDTVWCGWQVHVEARDSIVKHTSTLMKKRSEVVTAAWLALARQVAA